MASTATTPITTTVARIVAVLVAAQLAPRMETRPYRGARLLYFTGPRPESTFGTVTIGARTGRVLRAAIYHGNDGPVERFDDGRAFLRALRLIPGLHLRGARTSVDPDRVRVRVHDTLHGAENSSLPRPLDFPERPHQEVAA